MTDPISRLNPALELLRQRLAEQAQRLDSPAKGVSARAGSAPTGQADKRRRVFIESVLASELGEALQNDPKALELVERIEEAIQEHPELERQFRAVLSNYAGN